MRTICLALIASALAWGQISFSTSRGTAPYTTTTITASPMTILATAHGHGTSPVMYCYDTATPRAVIAPASENCAYTVAATGDIVLTYTSAPGLLLIYGGGMRGQIGLTGATGPPVAFIGDWAVGTTYAAGDAVAYNGSSYISTAADNVGNLPTDGTPWSVLAQKGSNGTDGTGTVAAGNGIGVTNVGSDYTVAIEDASVPQYTVSTGLPSTLADYATCTPGQRIHWMIDTGVQRSFWCRATSDWPEFPVLSGGYIAAANMPALTGDVTTSAGSVATTVVKINGTAMSGLATGILRNTTTTGVPSSAELSGDVTTSGSNATTLASKHKTRQFGFMLGGKTGAALADTEDEDDIFINRLGSGIHITQVSCRTDSATALTMNLQRNDGSAADILSSNLSCSSTIADSATFTSGEDAISDGHGVNLVVVSAGGGAKRLAVFVRYTVD